MRRKLPYAILAVDFSGGVTMPAYISAKEWLWVVSRASNGIAHTNVCMDGEVWVNKWNARLVKIVNPNKIKNQKRKVYDKAGV